MTSAADSPLFPLYQLMDAFEAFSHGEPSVKPQHRSLYYFLLSYARKRGNVPRFALPYEAGMHGSSIGSWTTYDAALRALAGWGFLVYTPGANRYKVPVVELTFRNPGGDELLTYWQAYCLAHPAQPQKQESAPPVELQKCNPSPSLELQNCRPTDNSTANSTGDIKKTFRHKTNDLPAHAESARASFSNSPPPASPNVGKGKPDKPSAVLGAEAGPTFVEFWEAYGKKTGRHKCGLRWRSLTAAERAAALAAVPAYVARKPELQYRKDPLTWLNGRHWEDEEPTPTIQPAPGPTQPQPVAPAQSITPALNHEVVAQREAERLARLDAERARWRADRATEVAQPTA